MRSQLDQEWYQTIGLNLRMCWQSCFKYFYYDKRLEVHWNIMLLSNNLNWYVTGGILASCQFEGNKSLIFPF
jgi:hypothetical protein